MVLSNKRCEGLLIVIITSSYILTTNPLSLVSHAYCIFTYVRIYNNYVHSLACRAGCYEHDIPRNRHVQWHQSFGGAPIKLPDVNIKSTIGSNTAKLLSTRDAKKHHRKLAYLKLYWD